MTQEENGLLMKDLCSRLPYRVKVTDVIDGRIVGFPYTLSLHINVDYAKIRPYLRPMSSMTEEEYEELEEISNHYGFTPFEHIDDWRPNYDITDWLDKNMFDYRGLIEKNLALKAPDGMYK